MQHFDLKGFKIISLQLISYSATLEYQSYSSRKKRSVPAISIILLTKATRLAIAGICGSGENSG